MKFYLIICFISISSLGESHVFDESIVSTSYALAHLSSYCYENHSMIIYSEYNLDDIHYKFFRWIFPQIPVVSIQHFKVLYDFMELHSLMIESGQRYLNFLYDYNVLLFTFVENRFLKTIRSIENVPSANTVFFIFNLYDVSCRIVDENLIGFYKAYQRIYYYLCTTPDDETMIYTINPFSTWAPRPWKLLKVINTKYSRKVSIFSRVYKLETVCDQLIFDRTTHLDGYPLLTSIEVSATFEASTVRFRSTESERFQYTVSEDIKEFLLQLEMVLNVTVKGYLTGRDEKGDHQHFLESEKGDGKIDIMLTLATEETEMYYERLKFPCRRLHYGIVSHNRGLKTAFEKMQDLYGIHTLLFTIFVLIVTFIGVWLIERRVSFAIFEILRLLITNGLETRMITLSSRILFGTILFYFLIIQAIFSGNMVNFVTLFVKRRNAESIDDLADLQYKNIYMLTGVRQMLTDEQNKLLNPKIEDVWDQKYCLHETIRNSSAACVSDYYWMFSTLLRHPVGNPKHGKIHISTSPIFDIYVYFTVSRESLLKDHLRIFMIQQWETGIYPHLLEEQDYHAIRAHRQFQYEYTAKMNEINAIKLDGLAFAFKFLGIGCLCATFCFIIELLYYYTYVRRKKRGKIVQPTPNVA